MLMHAARRPLFYPAAVCRGNVLVTEVQIMWLACLAVLEHIESHSFKWIKSANNEECSAWPLCCDSTDYHSDYLQAGLASTRRLKIPSFPMAVKLVGHVTEEKQDMQRETTARQVLSFNMLQPFRHSNGQNGPCFRQTKVSTFPTPSLSCVESS